MQCSGFFRFKKCKHTWAQEWLEALTLGSDNLYSFWGKTSKISQETYGTGINCYAIYLSKNAMFLGRHEPTKNLTHFQCVWNHKQYHLIRSRSIVCPLNLWDTYLVSMLSSSAYICTISLRFRSLSETNTSIKRISPPQFLSLKADWYFIFNSSIFFFFFKSCMFFVSGQKC